MKKLFLTSNTITENLVQDFESLIGKSIRDLKVAFIPDAGYGFPPDKDISWIETERQELIDLYHWNITDVVLKDAKTESLNILFKQDVIYVNGGLSGYLAKMMGQSGFDKLLPELLDKGIVYVGSSAGSMVMSEIQDASSWYIGEPEPAALDIPGLGYIDFQIYPHVKDENREDIINNCKEELTYCLMKDGSAVMINGDDMRLCGDIEVVSNSFLNSKI